MIAQFPFIYALGAAVLWAISAPIVSTGLAKVRQEKRPRQSILNGLAIGLIVATVALSIARKPPELEHLGQASIFLAGITTYILGTGFYYFTAVAYNENAGTAAQYANVKPILTFAAGLILFEEGLAAGKAIGASVIFIGIAVLLYGASRSRSDLFAAILGLLLALSWGGGEVFVKVASQTVDSGDITAAALAVSAVVAVALAVGHAALRHDLSALAPSTTALYFAAHGVLSFCFAYFLFFTSIEKIGLSSTVLVTVFWPTLAFTLNSIIVSGSWRATAPLTLAAMACFTLGSVLFVFLTYF